METPSEIAGIVEKALHDHTLREWELLYIHTNALLRMRMTVDRIHTSYEYKLAVRNVYANPRWLRSFSKALRATNFVRTDGNMDVRYSFIIRDNNSKDAVTVFMDFSNQLILLNDTLYRAKGELTGWFKDIAQTVMKMA